MQINPNEIIGRGIITLSQYSSKQQIGIDLSLNEAIEIGNSRSLNVLLNETINLPGQRKWWQIWKSKAMYAQFQQRSSYSRKGIFVTTGIYDPGYSGSLGCTIYNMSGDTISIPMGERVGQLVCYEADAASTYSGQYQNK